MYTKGIVCRYEMSDNIEEKPKKKKIEKNDKNTGQEAIYRVY